MFIPDDIDFYSRHMFYALCFILPLNKPENYNNLQFNYCRLPWILCIQNLHGYKTNHDNFLFYGLLTFCHSIENLTDCFSICYPNRLLAIGKYICR